MIKQKIQITKKLHDGSISTSKKLRHVDLFAGTGAFTLALSGIADTIYANDIDQSSKEIYDLNHKCKLVLQDINTINLKDIPPHDLLTAGPACQPFSIAGQQQGFQDSRSNVFWKVFEILAYHKPKIIIIENVKNLVTHDQGRTFKTITDNLYNLNYHLVYNVLNTAEITGIPQHRERIYIVGFQDKSLSLKFDMNFKVIPKQPITSLLDINVSLKYYYQDHTNKIHALIQKDVNAVNTVYQFRRVYIRENKNHECPTLTANMGTGGHNVPIVLNHIGPRKLTPRECFRFQGFPDTYQFGGLSDASLYKLVGNAVSVPVVELIGNRLGYLLT